MKKLFFCLALAFCHAEEQQFSLSSQRAYFDPRNLLLDGRIEFCHTMGKISADKGALCKDKKGKRFAELNGNVTLKLLPEGKITGERARFDLDANEILFSALEKRVECEKIVRGRKLFLSGKAIFCRLEEGILKKGGLDKVQSLELTGKVDILYDGNFHFIGGRAEYASSKDEGKLFLYPEPHLLCSFFYNDTRLNASFAKADLKKEEFFFANPQGEIVRSSTLEFSAKELYCHKARNELVLKYGVVLQSRNFGTLKADRINISADGKKAIAYGKISLAAAGGKGGMYYEGELLLDETSAQAIPKSGSQLLFKDDRVSILANKARLQYRKTGKKYIADSIALEGKISFFSSKIAGAKSYGSADRVVYEVPTKTIRLIADKDRKVRFSQGEGLMRFSSNEVQIQKETVKGIGTVHFIFDFEDEKHLEEIFLQHPENHE